MAPSQLFGSMRHTEVKKLTKVQEIFTVFFGFFDMFSKRKMFT